MKYTDWLIPELRQLEQHREFLRSAPERINELIAQSTRLKSSAEAKTPGGSSGENVTEISLINNLAERMQLEENLATVQTRVRWIENGMEQLTQEEYMVIDRFFVHRTEADCAQRLMEELHFEKSHVYRIKNRALIKLARVLCGVVEL